MSKLTGRRVHEIVLRNGVVLRAPHNLDLTFLFQEIWIDRSYTPVGFGIPPAATVLDIGANVGVFSLFAATCGMAARVHAYEPNPEAAVFFEANVAASGSANVTLHRAALASARGIRSLQVNPGNWLVSHLSDSPSGHPVTAVTLEEALDDNGLDTCAFMKMDCEGSEYEILTGAGASTLRRIQRIALEFHPPPDGKFGLDSLQKRLRLAGFEIVACTETAPKNGTLVARRV